MASDGRAHDMSILDFPDMPKDAPLHRAAYKGDLATIEQLLSEGGSDVNVRGASDRTPLHRAVGNGHAGVVIFLIKKGAKVDSTDNGGLTPLHWTALFGLPDMAQILIEAKADINARTNMGETCVHLCAEKGHSDFLKFLLEYKPDTHLLDKFGRSAYELAKLRGQKEVASLLKRISHEEGILGKLRKGLKKKDKVQGEGEIEDMEEPTSPISPIATEVVPKLPAIRPAENVNTNPKVILIQKRFDQKKKKKKINLLDKADRHLVAQGPMIKSGVKFQAILLNDQFVLATAKNAGFGYKLYKRWMLGSSIHFSFKDMIDKKGKNAQNRIQFVTPKKTYVLVVKNAEQKIKWLRVLTKVLNKLHASMLLAPNSPGGSPGGLTSNPSLARPTSSPLFGKFDKASQRTHDQFLSLPVSGSGQPRSLTEDASGRALSPSEVRLMAVINENDNRMHELVQNLSNLVREVDNLKKKKHLLTQFKKSQSETTAAVKIVKDEDAT